MAQTGRMRFNPPPNWPPAPPGWTPPPDWQPDASWPPVPPDWPLWVPEEWVPEGSGRRKTGLVIGALVAALLIGVGVVAAIVAANRSPNIAVATATTTTEETKSDETQLRDVVQQFEQAWNDEDFDGLAKLFCEEMHAEAEFGEPALREMREMSGRLALTITSLDIDGDTATATILNEGEDPDDIGFTREDGDWKWCEL